MVTLSTALKGYGIRLTFHNSDKFAGDINRTENAGRPAWRFVPPDGINLAPLRRTMEAAQYDALAHWEDQAAM